MSLELLVVALGIRLEMEAIKGKYPKTFIDRRHYGDYQRRGGRGGRRRERGDKWRWKET